MRHLAAWVMMAAAAVCSCDGQQSMLPKSGGRPYEVLVIAKEKPTAAAVDSVLSQDTEGLPQAEPMFDVSVTDSVHFNQTAKLARNIVIINIDSTLFTATRMRYEKNVWARPQMVVYVNSPSMTALNADLPKAGRQLVSLLTRSEMNTEISRLSTSHNAKAGETAGKVSGWSVRIPADMKAGKKGSNFAWFSNNAASGMQNICIYSYPADKLSPERALTVRDSVMKVNIPGERDGMYMQTARATVRCGMAKERGRDILVSRGLWEMHGDAMGGPFVSHSILDSAKGRVIVAEAFVYAPEMKKRNLIRQLEAALYTLDKPDKRKR